MFGGEDAGGRLVTGKKKESKPRRFRFWAYLNAEGMKLFGEVFPEGWVPVVSMVPLRAECGDSVEMVYLVFHEEMSKKQVDGWLRLLAERFGASVADVRAQMLRDRIALRAKYVDGAGTDGLPLLI